MLLYILYITLNITFTGEKLNLTLSTLHKQCMLTPAAAELISGILIPYTVVLSRPQYAYF